MNQRGQHAFSLLDMIVLLAVLGVMVTLAI